MPNAGTGAVQIPVINQTVDTPELGRPRLPVSPFHAEPVQSDVGSALEGVGKTLVGYFAAQQQHADAIDVAQRMNGFQQAFGQAKQDALESGQTAPNMITGLQSASAKLIDQYQNGTVDPNNPNPPSHGVAQKLALAMNQHIAEQMQSFPAEAAQRVSHDLDFKFQQQNASAAATAGPNYTIGGTADAPTFQLNADGLQTMNRQAALIDQAYPPNSRPTENQFYRNDLAQKAVLQTGMAIARDHPTLTDKFIEQHSAVIPQAQQLSLMNQATAAIRRPAEQLEANNANLNASLTNKYLSQVQSGNLDVASLDDDAAHQRISRDNYQRITGYQFAPPGNPSAIAAMNKQISSATDENDLETLRGTINGPENAELYGKGAIPLNAAIENAKRQMNTVAGQARVSAYDQIRRTYQAIGAGPLGPTMYNMSASLAGSPTLTELQTNAKADFEAAIYGETNPAKIRAAMQKAISDNAPDASLLKPKGTPPAITDSEARGVVAHARKIGLIH